MRHDRSLCLLNLVLLALSPSVSNAQNRGFDLGKINTPDPGSPWVLSHSLSFRNSYLGKLPPNTWADTLMFMFSSEYAHSPMAIVAADGSIIQRIVEYVCVASLDTSVSPNDWLRLSILVPFQYLATDAKGVDYRYFYLPPGPEKKFGDIRIGGTTKILSLDNYTFAFNLYVFLPTGKASSYISDEAFRFEPGLWASGIHKRFSRASGASFHGRSRCGDKFGDYTISDDVTLNTSIGYETPDKSVSVGPELKSFTPVKSNGLEYSSSSAILIVGVHHTFTEGWRYNISAGTGIGNQVGIPFLVGSVPIEIYPKVEVLHDNVDATTENITPKDEEITVVEPNTAPKDSDGDGIIDYFDACKDQRGPERESMQTNGCPDNSIDVSILDTDSDGIGDQEDACPTLFGSVDSGGKHGCPAIKLDSIKFKSHSGILEPETEAVLVPVVRVLKQISPFYKFIIKGFTDSSGREKDNQFLSTIRAKSVMEWFINQNMDPNKFEYHGYGSKHHIAPNDTPENRARNRRVEIEITPLH